MEARRVARGLLVASVLLSGLAGCKSDEPPPPPVEKKKLELDPSVSQKIDEALDLLNNTNKEERWLKQLIAAAETDELARRAAIDRTVAAIKRSWANPQGGQGILKSEGVARAIRGLDRFAGDDPAALDVFKQASKVSDSSVAGAAAAALATRGDSSSFASLLQSVKSAKNDRVAQDRAAGALVKIVKPEQKDEVLAAVDAGSRDALAPVVSACLPAEPEPRALALAAIVKEHANPQARILALDELRKAGEPEIVDFARTQANADDADLRGYARKLLAAQGGKVAATQLAGVLSEQPKDPDGAAKLLASVDSPDTVTLASEIVASGSRMPAARAACARHVLARVRDDKAPAALKDPAARERALGVLRRAINDSNEEVARASIQALGVAGDESDAESLALLVSRSAAQAQAAIEALGKIGGAAAAEKLVSTHESDPRLRAACRDALIGMKNLRAIDFNQGVLLIQQLLSSDLEVRKSALAVLRSLKGDSDIFDYKADADAGTRGRSVDRWVGWWKDKVAQRGG